MRPPQKIAFRRVTPADHPLLRRWLSAPHVRRWWGPPDEEIALLCDGEATGETKGYVILLSQCPIGNIQSWSPTKSYDEAWAGTLEPKARGMDLAFAARLLAQGASRVIIDPDTANTQAIRAYEKAGFTRIGTWDDTCLMAFEPSE